MNLSRRKLFGLLPGAAVVGCAEETPVPGTWETVGDSETLTVDHRAPLQTEEDLQEALQQIWDDTSSQTDAIAVSKIRGLGTWIER